MDILEKIYYIYQSPDLKGDDFCLPLKRFNGYLFKKIEESEGLQKCAWVIATVVSGIFAYPFLGISAGIGLLVKLKGIEELRNYNRHVSNHFCSGHAHAELVGFQAPWYAENSKKEYFGEQLRGKVTDGQSLIVVGRFMGTKERPISDNSDSNPGPFFENAPDIPPISRDYLRSLYEDPSRLRNCINWCTERYRKIIPYIKLEAPGPSKEDKDLESCFYVCVRDVADVMLLQRTTFREELSMVRAGSCGEMQIRFQFPLSECK